MQGVYMCKAFVYIECVRHLYMYGVCMGEAFVYIRCVHRARVYVRGVYV